MKSDPWYKATYSLQALGTNLKLAVPHDVFSTMRIDEGTLLLLENLPTSNPKSILDMGCGYGALGLPIAAKFPEAKVEMVDRDLLAAGWSRRNALENHLNNTEVHGSLGFRDLDKTLTPYNWILCNVPARIGRPFIKHLFGAGQSLLAPGGEIRVVVIRDLVPLLEELKIENGWPLKEQARGPRHSVFSLQVTSPGKEIAEPNDLYARDMVEIGGLKLERPFDLGGDDPKRLASGLPVLLDVMPKKAPLRVLCFRTGYGPLPLICRAKWPEAQITAVDRDLLGTTFTRRNAERLGLGGERLSVRENEHFPNAITPGETFDLAMGELSPSAGKLVAEAEIEALAKFLTPQGQALILILEKLERDWIKPLATRAGLVIERVISRESYALLRLSAPRPPMKKR